MKRAARMLGIWLALWAPAAMAQHESEKTESHGEGHGDPWIWWKWANFAILAGALGYLIAKKAGPFFQSRNEEIQKGIRESAKLKQEAEARAAQMEERLRNLDREIAQLRSSASAEMAAENERIHNETRQQLAKAQAAAEQEIASAAKAAQQELKAYSGELALKLAEQKIRGRVTPEVEAALLETFVRGLGERKVQ